MLCHSYRIRFSYFSKKVKKIARRQNQDGGKNKKDGDSNNEKTKLKSTSEKKDEDSESDSSFIGNTEQNGRLKQ